MKQKPDYVFIFLVFSFIAIYAIHNFETYFFMKDTRDAVVKIHHIIENLGNK